MAKKDMTKDQFSLLLESTESKKYRLIWRLLAGCGLRSIEATTLKVRDLDLKHQTLTIRTENSKTGKERVVVVPRSLLSDLQDWIDGLNHDDYLFVGQAFKDGTLQPLTTRAIRKAFKLACGQSPELEGFTPHSLRHFAVEQMDRANINLNFIRHQVGHASLRTTQIYLSNSVEGRKEAINASGFEI